jgi:2-C-methyl-D-erythritol 2,4-cyclodiphosphate synthase
MRIGIGIDFHQLTEGRPLILGGVDIPFKKGLLGHSDADVLSHAIADALLGAAAIVESIFQIRMTVIKIFPV